MFDIKPYNPNLPLLRTDELLFIDTSKAPTPNSNVNCLLCGKAFYLGFFIGEPDQICSECKKTYGELAKIVCAKCKITIGRTIPKKLDNGFIIKPKTILHIDSCNICNPGLKVSKIIEISMWERYVREHRPTITHP